MPCATRLSTSVAATAYTSPASWAAPWWVWNFTALTVTVSDMGLLRAVDQLDAVRVRRAGLVAGEREPVRRFKGIPGVLHAGKGAVPVVVAEDQPAGLHMRHPRREI